MTPCNGCGEPMEPWTFNAFGKQFHQSHFCRGCCVNCLQAIREFSEAEERVIRQYLEAQRADWWKRGDSPPEWKP